MQTAPLVSAIVPVYNGERYLAEALDSALAQTYEALEIIVVDDGSTDSSGAIADRYAESHPQKIRVVHRQNGGLVSARNAAIAIAHGRYLAILDCDDLWMPNHVAEAVALLEHDQEVGLVHARIRAFDSNGFRARASERDWQPGDDAVAKLLLRREHVSNPTVVFRRSLIDVVGPFDPAFNRLGCEDRDMWLRIAKVQRLAFIDSLHAHYRLHDDNMSKNQKKMFEARCRIVDRHAQGRYRAMRRPAMAAIHHERGYDLHRDGHRLRAMASYLRALAWSPLRPLIWKGIARCLMGSASCAAPVSSSSNGDTRPL